MKKIVSLLIALFTLSTTHLTQATPILSLDRVSPATIAVGDVATFELRVSGLSTLLGAFSADISYDSSVLSFLPESSITAQFGTRLGDLSASEAVGTVDASVSDALHIDQVSLLGTPALEALQHDAFGQLLPSFVLAEIRFQGVAPGTSSLNFTPVSTVLSDEAGNSLASLMLTGSSISVTGDVPEPGSAWLLLLGLALVTGFNCINTRRAAC